jgi:glycosyltransferase involved in cell wall biosynthesis
VNPPFKILQLGTYPIKRPQHGGQRRVSALRSAYRAAGLEAEYLAVYHPGAFSPATVGRHDIPIGPVTRARIARSPYLEDVFAGESLLHDQECRERFLSFWRRFRPDVVAFEHPYLWASLRRLIEDGALPRCPVIYSSQNVESDMKAEIYAHTLPPAERRPAAEKVRQVEDDLARHCDVLVAVHHHDAERLRRAGKPCLLMPNGGEVQKVPGSARRKWARRLSDSRRRRALFVGSNHLPNYQGFAQLLGPALGYLPPGTELLIVGGVCNLFRASPLCTGPLAGVNESRMRLLGCLPDGDLAALIELSQLVLLPITSGGGSNLKTVEALLSGKPIVGTRYAFRAYEDFAACGRVTLADEPAAFKRALREQLETADGARRSLEWEQRLQELTWPSLGRVFVAELLACLAGAGRDHQLAA